MVRVVPRAAVCTSRSQVSFSPITLHTLVKYKPMNVPQPPQSEIDELAHRVLCIIELCKDTIFRARRTLAERAGRDPNKEITSANAMLSVLPTLRQALPATAASKRGVSVCGDRPNPLKRDHDSMVSGTAVSLVLRIPRYIVSPARLDPFFILSLPHLLAFRIFCDLTCPLTPTRHVLRPCLRRVLLSRANKRLKWSSSGTRGWPPNLASRVNTLSATYVLISRSSCFSWSHSPCVLLWRPSETRSPTPEMHFLWYQRNP